MTAHRNPTTTESMLRSYFGIDKSPFAADTVRLLPHQQEIFDVLLVHCQQGGLCLLLGEPGTGKSVIRRTLEAHDTKRMIVATVGRTLHTYCNTVRILCSAFQVDFEGGDFKCEKKLIEQAFKLNHLHKMIVPAIDDAHLLDITTLRKLRLLLEEFPKNHNLILLGQPDLLTKIRLSVNEDIHSRVTYSATLLKLNPDQIRDFILSQLDQCGLGHNVFTEEALALLVRSAEGILRRAKNLCISALIEAVREQVRTVDLAQVNRALIQPHWRNQRESTLEAHQ